MVTGANEAMSRYQITANDDFSKFIRVDENVNLNDLDRKRLATYPEGSGVYFWVMRRGNHCFKIYAGRTTSLPRRVREYANNFQPGVPNDYKMRHFQNWMRERFADAQLDLYFCKTDQHVDEEKRIVRETRPFINVRAGSDEAALRDCVALRHANWEYYRNGFDRRCAEKPASE